MITAIIDHVIRFRWFVWIGVALLAALSVYALMVGTLQLSRALVDQQLADTVLEQGIQSALTLISAEGWQ